jgi:two-component system probable response regulator PhcQ
MSHTVLFVDDEPHVTEALKRGLRREPYEILSARSAAEALEILAHKTVDVVVSDERMPGISGSEFLSVVCKKHPAIIRIILTGNATLDAAIRAINEGEIYRFLTKPCNDVDLAVTIRQALQQKALISGSQRLLKTVRYQSALFQELEKEHPGITSVKRDSAGTILVEDTECDLQRLLEQIDSEVSKGETGSP